MTVTEKKQQVVCCRYHSPLPVVDKSLHLTNKVWHGRCHLNLFLSMKQATQVDAFHFQCTVFAQYCFSCEHRQLTVLDKQITLGHAKRSLQFSLLFSFILKNNFSFFTYYFLKFRIMCVRRREDDVQ